MDNSLLAVRDINHKYIVVERRKYLKECLREMLNISNRYNAVWCKVGKCSVKGHPHYPLYVKKDSRIEAFGVKTYLTSLWGKEL